MLQQTQYWEPDAIRETLKANDKVTFYAKHGDYLSRISVYLTFVLLITWIAFSIVRWNQAGERPAKTKKSKKK